jgi:hypothetical protein
MSYEIAPLVLYSQDRTRMLNFLSDVFEFEISEEDHLVCNQGLFFKVENYTETINTDQMPQVQFNFKVNDVNNLDEIINKYNFFKYRRGDNSGRENLDLFENEKYKSLTIFDVDNRPWNFIFYKNKV